MPLIEIGLWQSLDTFQRPSDSPRQFRDRLLGETAHLKGTVGAIYANAVRECLSVSSPTDSAMDTENQKKLCWNIVAELDRCVA